jgi:1-acyl-sn-glycerol-3-phosphate acyltransferase
MMTDDDLRAPALLAILRETCAALHPHLATTDARIDITLDSSLERELGFDSLARVELLLRIERAFGVTLPENTLQSAETPRDLLQALAAAQPQGPRQAGAPVQPEPIVRQENDGDPDDTPLPTTATTLTGVLEWHVRRHGTRTQIIFLAEAGDEHISYSQLHAGAAAVAAGLRGCGLLPQQTVAIMLPTSADYFFSYFGILMAGGIPVPIYPPARLSQIEEHIRRHTGILENAQATLLVTVPQAMTVARLLEAEVPTLRQAITVAELMRSGTHEMAPSPTADAEDIAFIQYTSGSTGNPKGVVLTHANLLANIRAIGAAIHIKTTDVFVSWLPLYHDMGLISAWLASLYFGNPLVVMSPLTFLARPERWLWAIHRYRGTLTAAPNFAYELCLKRLSDHSLEGLDLSSLRLMANGAEPVSPDTLARFATRFAACGLSPGALTPVYGLAEASVGLAVPPLGRGPQVDRIDRETFVRNHRAVPAAADDPQALRFVACGQPLPGHQVRIVDATGLEVGERVEGALEFRGPSATRGYYRNPEATQQLFHGTWLDSGDRAYIAAGEIYLTGRVKDIIIRGGRNIYPHELELAVGDLPGVRKGCVAVFGSPDPHSGTERLIVLAETRETDAQARAALIAHITQRAISVLGEPADEVVLAPPHTVLKTSSGKIRRAACRDLYAAGLIGTQPAWGSRWPGWPIVRLTLRTLLPQARRMWVLSGEVLHAARVWLLFWIIAPLTWLATAATPRPTWAWAIARTAARLFFRFTGTPLTVHGLGNLPPAGQPCILVANHASYVDAIILAAVLPRHIRFVAKRELESQLIPRIYLRRLATEFVERFSTQQSAADAARLVTTVAHGHSLALFPEGTFTRTPGLRAFRLGAFVAAVQAQVPVVPLAIRGSRTWLRADQWFPRRSALEITIGTPLTAPAAAPDAFAAAIRLRDAARAEIQRHCGEPTLEFHL